MKTLRHAWEPGKPTPETLGIVVTLRPGARAYERRIAAILDEDETPPTYVLVLVETLWEISK